MGLPYNARDGGDWRDAEIMTTEEVPSIIKCMMHRSTLSCPFRLRPLMPPLYQCKGEHQLACMDYRGERQCQKCDGDGGFNVRITWVDDFFTDMKADCWHEGCGLNVNYYNLDDHQSACLFTPCKCSVPGCRYEVPPTVLTHHLSTMHLMPAHRIHYGKVLQLQVPVSEQRFLLIAEEDGRMFFMVGDVLGMDAPIAVSVICIRAGASPPSYYTAKVWANGPAGSLDGRTDTVELEIEVTNSKEPGAVAMEELTFLTVPPTMLARARSSRTVSLHIWINKLTSYMIP